MKKFLALIALLTPCTSSMVQACYVQSSDDADAGYSRSSEQGRMRQDSPESMDMDTDMSSEMGTETTTEY
jgi:hypothetical protein